MVNIPAELSANQLAVADFTLAPHPLRAIDPPGATPRQISLPLSPTPCTFWANPEVSQ